MKYAKPENGYPKYAPNPILHNGLWYGNPPGEIYGGEWKALRPQNLYQNYERTG